MAKAADRGTMDVFNFNCLLMVKLNPLPSFCLNLLLGRQKLMYLYMILFFGLLLCTA
jgi:hypothetical protein